MAGTHVGIIYGIADQQIRRIVWPEDRGSLSDPALTGPAEAIKVIAASAYQLCRSETEIAQLVGLVPK